MGAARSVRPVSDDTAPVRPQTAQFADYLTRLGQRLDAAQREQWSDSYPRRASWEPALAGPLPERGAGADDTLQVFLDHLVDNPAPLSAPHFWAWITSGPITTPAVVAAGAAVAAPQRGALTPWNFLEEQSLEWLGQLCGLPEHLKGLYSSGGSTANLVALGAARQWAYEQIGIDPARDGVMPAGEPGGVVPRPTIYSSAQVHHTINRSAGVLGLGRSAMRIVPVTSQRTLDVDALRAQLAADVADGCLPIAVVGIAGTTDTGVIDPLDRIADVAAEFGVWFHVDGAYGLPGSLDPRVTDRYAGIERADSVIVDPHKWLNAPVGVAATFVRDRGLLYRAFTQEPAAYLTGTWSDEGVEVSLDAMGIPYADFGVELSAPPRGVQVWAILRELGRSGVQARIVADNDFARQVQDYAEQHPALEVLCPVVLSICCFRYRGRDGVETDLDAVNKTIIRRLLRETPFVISSTEVDGAYALRPCFINARTTPEHVADFLATVVRLGDEITA
jgi:aromatic-L-amino-acid/L-tryptophan decarboxylase